MGRSKGAKARKTKEMIVGSDVDSDVEETPVVPEEEPEEQPPAAVADSESEEDDDKPKKKKEYKGSKKMDQKGGKKGKKGGKGAEEEKPAEKHVDPSPKKEEAEIEKDEEGSDDESDEEETKKPRVVLYCPTCSFQAEMCEYSGMFDKCKPWLEENAKEIAAGEEKGRKRKGVYADGEGPVPGAKLKKKPDQCVTFTVKKRSGRKVVTLITGLDFYGVNMKEICREWKKKFSCGCGIIETPGELDAVEVQGDVVEALGKILPEKHKIPAKDLWRKDGKDRTRVCPDA